MRKVVKVVKWLFVLLFASSIVSVIVLRFVPVVATPLMFIRCFQQIGDGESIKLHHSWVSLDDMPKSMPVAVMASEDQNFLKHHGFDYGAIQRAARENMQGGRIRGGSTISQQTAKNVFLWPGRSWVRKGLETYFTFLIELFWSKQRIMEVYLNSIETGDGIYGVEAISRDNWGLRASQLSREQCALIAATLPNPRKFSSKHPSAYIQKRQKRIIREMNYIEKHADSKFNQ